MSPSPLDFVPPAEKENVVTSSARRKGIMLCYPLEERRLTAWQPPFFVQPKLDGERCRDVSVYDPDVGFSPLLVSSECNPIISLPNICDALIELDSALRRSLFPLSAGWRLDGELYVHGWSFERIHSCVSRTVNPHPDSFHVRFFVFDIWNSSAPQYERTSELMKLQKHFPPSIVLVPTKLCNTFDDVMRAYDAFVDEGYEGIIVRNVSNLYISREDGAYRSPYILKFKPKKQDSYVITGAYEATSSDGSGKNYLGMFECRDNEGNIFRVSPGTGCTEDKKRRWWTNRDQLVGRELLVEYQNLTSDRHVPRFGRFPLAANLWLEVI